MISPEEAIRIAEGAFPKGPEAVAEHLGVKVIVCKMSGCDGWCLSFAGSVIIRINENTPRARQRFTLAHELAHLLLGMAPDILPARAEPLSSSRAEEREANQLAAELLLPKPCLEQLITSIPADATILRKVAKKAEVSEVMVACRVATLAKELGLVNAAVIGFENDSPKWTWSTTLTVEEVDAEELLKKAKAKSSGVFRGKNRDGRVVVASALGSPAFPVLFVQLLPPDLGNTKTLGEQIKELGSLLFEGDDRFRNQLNGKFGYFCPKSTEMTLEEAVEQFNARYSKSWSSIAEKRKFNGQLCQQYVRLRLSEWCKK